MGVFRKDIFLSILSKTLSHPVVISSKDIKKAVQNSFDRNGYLYTKSANLGVIDLSLDTCGVDDL